MNDNAPIRVAVTGAAGQIASLFSFESLPADSLVRINRLLLT